MGWTSVIPGEAPPKSIICVAPHTSNYDFLMGKLYYWAVGRKAGFLMKKEWFFFPLGVLFRAMGGDSCLSFATHFYGRTVARVYTQVFLLQHSHHSGGDSWASDSLEDGVLPHSSGGWSTHRIGGY